jgi:hypothetical protein
MGMATRKRLVAAGGRTAVGCSLFPMIPRWFKLAYLASAAVLVPAYALEHGWVNFLWFSNVAPLGGSLLESPGRFVRE